MGLFVTGRESEVKPGEQEHVFSFVITFFRRALFTHSVFSIFLRFPGFFSAASEDSFKCLFFKSKR